MRAGLLSLGLLSGACAAFGYDFDEYQPADSGGTSGDGTSGDGTSGGGASAAGETSREEPVTSAVIGTMVSERPAAGGAGGETCGGAAGESPGGSITTFCEPSSCFELGAQCGAVDDGCGQSLDCGSCFWWFETCQDNLCVILDNPSK